MKTTLVLLLVAASSLVAASPRSLSGEQSSRIPPQDALLSVPALIRKYGYPAEEHEVTTEDGHVLGIFRIPYGKESPDGPDKPVVLMQHGLLSCSADWVIMGPQRSLGYLLADRGYDVWLGNNRGTTYSRGHTTLNVSDSNGPFWNYSWHEMGVFDIPAVVDYILNVTGQEQISYIGHSQGTTQFFVMASERPEYNAKIRAMFSFAPVAFMDNVPNPIIKILASNVDIMVIEQLLGVQEILSHTSAMTVLGDQFCRDGAVTQPICTNFIFLMCGFNPSQFDASMFPVIVGHLPAGASSKSLVHYAQEIISGHFRKFDYHENNMAVYGTDTPPDYDLSKITAKVYLHYSSNDWLAATEDVERLHKGMPNSELHLVALPEFNHIDYTWGIDAKTLLYDLVFRQIDPTSPSAVQRLSPMTLLSVLLSTLLLIASY